MYIYSVGMKSLIFKNKTKKTVTTNKTIADCYFYEYLKASLRLH